jgi:hypothetical protein
LITGNGISNRIRLEALSNRDPRTLRGREAERPGARRMAYDTDKEQLGADLLALLGEHGGNR